MLLDNIKKSWPIYRKNFFAMTSASAIVFLVFAVTMIAGMMMIFNLSPYSLMTSAFNPETAELNDSSLLVPGIIVIAIGVIIMILFQGGLYGMAFESITKATHVKTFFATTKKKWLPILGVFALEGMAFGLLMIPSFIIISVVPYTDIVSLCFVILITLVSVLFSFIVPAIVDNKGIIESIKTSFSITTKKYTDVLVIVLFFGAISWILGMIPVLGTAISFLIIMPWNYTALCYFYKKNRKI
jgi:hypothetical protein